MAQAEPRQEKKIDLAFKRSGPWRIKMLIFIFKPSSGLGSLWQMYFSLDSLPQNREGILLCGVSSCLMIRNKIQ